MATSTVTPESSAQAGLEPSIAIAASDTVTQRRIAAALIDGSRLSAPDPSAAPRPREASVLVLAADLADPEAATAVRVACESARPAAVVVVTPPGRDWEVRRALR